MNKIAQRVRHQHFDYALGMWITDDIYEVPADRYFFADDIIFGNRERQTGGWKLRMRSRSSRSFSF